jgi:hypothetical protein
LPRSRAAIPTIKGYFYQFDYFILKLLETPNDSDIVCIEGIEDIDINTTNETIAIQCKYYEGTEYNHSLLCKPIKLMLEHYANKLKNGECINRYAIYGHYSSGQHKLSNNLDIQFFKEHFFTYSGHKIHEELKLDDNELLFFIQNLSIRINAPSYEEQENKIIDKLKQFFSCYDYEANYYYNNALYEVKRLSTMKDENARKITKGEFITLINKKDILFNIWFMKKKGNDKYCKLIKKQFFTKYNIFSCERFFLLECDALISDVELKSILQVISKKWSKLSKREPNSFCPYVYIHNIPADRLIRIKKLLQSDGFCFLDGYDFKGSDFSVNSICKKATCQNGIKLKIIDEKEQINNILSFLSITREIYQFFKDEPFYENMEHKHIRLFIEETNYINSII